MENTLRVAGGVAGEGDGLNGKGALRNLTPEIIVALYANLFVNLFIYF